MDALDLESRAVSGPHGSESEFADQAEREDAGSPAGDPPPRRGWFRRRRDAGAAQERRFLALAPDPENLAVLLECLYTARLLKKRHTSIETSIFTHPVNAELLELTGVFDRIEPLEEDESWRQRILDAGPDVLYLPDQSIRAHLATLFTGIKLRIGGTRHRLVSRLLRFHKLNQAEDLQRLQRRGLNLFPELSDLEMHGDLPTEHLVLPAQDYIVLSLFDAHDLTSGWPPGHAARLARLARGMNLQLVVPLSPSLSDNGAPDAAGENGAGDSEHLRNWRRLRGEIEYLRRGAGVEFIPNCLPVDRAAIMLGAQAVVGPAGPETVLASLLKKPVVVLHDMKTFRNHPGHVRPPGLHPEEAAAGEIPSQFGEEGPATTLAALREQNIPLTSYYIKLADSFERHIMPAVDHCNKECPSCSFQSCVEYISPERVFEQLKKTVLPF